MNSSLLKVLVLCLSVTGCVTSQFTQNGTDTIKWDNRTAIYEHYKALYGEITSDDVRNQLGEPTIIEKSGSWATGFGYKYKQSSCLGKNLFFYKISECEYEDIYFLAMFWNDELREVKLVDERDTSSASAFTSDMFMELVYMRHKMAALSDVLNDSLDKFAEKHLSQY